jgi:hypothetical protein
MITFSPFEENANAVLTFKVGTGIYQRDLASGNQIEVVSTIEVKAMLNVDRSTQSIAVMGLDRSQTPLKGRAVDPLYLPASICAGARAGGRLMDMFTGAEQVGEFVVSRVHASPFAAVTELLGSAIEGYFRIDNAGEVLSDS